MRWIMVWRENKQIYAGRKENAQYEDHTDDAKSCEDYLTKFLERRALTEFGDRYGWVAASKFGEFIYLCLPLIEG